MCAPAVGRSISMAAAVRAAGGRGSRFAFGFGNFGIGATAVALRFGGGHLAVRAVRLRGGLAAVLEVGGIPARALELKAGGRYEFRQRVFLARRTHGERRVGKLLKHLV